MLSCSDCGGCRGLPAEPGGLLSTSVRTEQGQVHGSVVEITQGEEVQVSSLRHLQQLLEQELLHSGHTRLVQRLTWVGVRIRIGITPCLTTDTSR